MSLVVLQRAMPKNPGWPVPGVLTLPGFKTFVVIEDPYILRDGRVTDPGWWSAINWPYTPLKIPGVTAIPAGKYRLCLFKSTRFKRYLPAVCDVPGFTGILVHPGNWQEDTTGCILPGLDVAEAGRMVTSSTAAVEQIVNWLDAQEEPTWIEVKNPA